MQISAPTPRPARESIVPMINVVFLLLVFFLISAQLAPPEPFEITPPEAEVADPAEGRDILFIGADGSVAYGEARGDAVFARLAAEDREETLLVRADASVAGADIARVLARLAATDVGPVTLVATAR